MINPCFTEYHSFITFFNYQEDKVSRNHIPSWNTLLLTDTDDESLFCIIQFTNRTSCLNTVSKKELILTVFSVISMDPCIQEQGIYWHLRHL